MSTFNNAKVLVGSTATTVYTTPAAKTSVIHGLFISNIDPGGNQVTVTISVFDGVNTWVIGQSLPVYPQTTLTWDKPINLLTSEQLRVTCSTSNSATAFASILEN